MKKLLMSLSFLCCMPVYATDYYCPQTVTCASNTCTPASTSLTFTRLDSVTAPNDTYQLLEVYSYTGSNFGSNDILCYYTNLGDLPQTTLIWGSTSSKVPDTSVTGNAWMSTNGVTTLCSVGIAPLTATLCPLTT